MQVAEEDEQIRRQMEIIEYMMRVVELSESKS